MNETEKYTEVWKDPKYRRYSPGELYVWVFLKILKEHKIQRGGKLAEIACGVGRAGLILNNWFDVIKYDLAANCLDDLVSRETFSVLDITKDKLPKVRIGYCCDTMEHIPTEYVMVALNNIMKSCRYGFFTISTHIDDYGEMILGEPLHLTIRPFTWWRDRLNEVGHVIEARDLLNDTAFLVAHK